MTQLGGLKNDDEKPDLSLFSATWLFGVGSVLTFGKKKYAAHNWRKGIKISRLMAAALRHILAFNNGEDADPESGLSHLDHASCCLMFARELIETRRKEVDDRYRMEQLELPFPKNTAETQWNGRVPGDKREPEKLPAHWDTVPEYPGHIFVRRPEGGYIAYPSLEAAHKDEKSRAVMNEK